MRARTFAAVVCALALGAAPAAAQGLRGTARTTVRYFELRPIAHDTVSFSAVEERPDGTFQHEGLPISCVPELHCVRYRATDTRSALVLTQDVAMSAWGLGVQGLSARIQLRSRTGLAGEFEWPRSDDPFDAIVAYAELLRGDFRVRAGRLQNLSGLGFNSYDGAHVLYAPAKRLRLEFFGGRSLARGVYEPRHDALAGIEAFFPDRNAVLVGGAVEGDPWAHTSVALRYQRELWTNRSALVSERASVDVQSSVLAPVQLAAGVDYDVAFGRVGKSNLNVRLPLDEGRVILEAVASRYVPYFELWTIWGYFSPVAHHEVEARVAWRKRPDLTLRGAAGYRRYGDAHAPVIFDPLPNDAVFGTLTGTWTASPDLSLDTGFRLERGFGAYLGSGDVAARLRLHERVSVTLDGSVFQQIEEFRLGNGVVLGAGGAVDVQVTAAAALSGGAHVYRQTWEHRAGDTNWNQVRAWASLRIDFGRDPGRGAP